MDGGPGQLSQPDSGASRQHKPGWGLEPAKGSEMQGMFGGFHTRSLVSTLCNLIQVEGQVEGTYHKNWAKKQ